MALLAAQMYTLRDHCKTAADLASACTRVKKMGYDGVQLSGVVELPGDEMKKILDDNGLQCCVTHISIDAMENNTEAVIERHQKMNCKYTAIGGFFPKEEWTRDLWENFIVRYNNIAQKFIGSGIKIGYHNHSHEFAPAGGVRPMDLLMQKLDQENTWMEIDTYWVQHGGADPAEYIRRAAGRIPCVHFKDMTITPQRTPKMTEICDGNLNWPRIIEACRYAGVQWYIVERDAGDLDPFDSLSRSCYNLREKMGL